MKAIKNKFDWHVVFRVRYILLQQTTVNVEQSTYLSTRFSLRDATYSLTYNRLPLLVLLSSFDTALSPQDSQEFEPTNYIDKQIGVSVFSDETKKSTEFFVPVRKLSLAVGRNVGVTFFLFEFDMAALCANQDVKYCLLLALSECEIRKQIWNKASPISSTYVNTLEIPDVMSLGNRNMSNFHTVNLSIWNCEWDLLFEMEFLIYKLK